MSTAGPLISQLGTAPVSAGPSSTEEAASALVPGFGISSGTDTLLIGCFVLAIIAIYALTNTFASRRKVRELAREARSQSDAMRELLRAARAAENIAGIGVWQYDCEARVQHWSDGLKRLFGIEPDEAFVEGDAETLLYANDVDLVGWAKSNSSEVEPYTLQFDVFCFDSVPRRISIQACNLRRADGTVQRIVAVLRDVSEEVLNSQRPRRPWKFGSGSDGTQTVTTGTRHGPQALPETDQLTGLSNRRAVMGELDQLVMDARSGQSSLVLVMFDIDHFERLVRAHGKPAGDRVLKQVASLAHGQARCCDLIGRVGDEEFVWIIPDVSVNNARVLTERMRQTIAQGSGVDDIPPVTISLGLAGLQPGDGALSLFARADNALFDAKRAGHNRVRAAA